MDLGTILVIAPHPDDETMGAGGLLLNAKQSGSAIHWLIATRMFPEDGWPQEKMEAREGEIDRTAKAFGFDSVHVMPFAAAKLDQVPMGDLIGAFSKVVTEVRPKTVLLPHLGDAHSDHAAVHHAGAACAKWFRYPSVKHVMVYETLSETDAAIQDASKFIPNVFFDISEMLEQKIKILSIFESELQAFPFPRSSEAVRALAQVRGAACGVKAAEAYMLLRSIN